MVQRSAAMYQLSQFHMTVTASAACLTDTTAAELSQSLTQHVPCLTFSETLQLSQLHQTFEQLYEKQYVSNSWAWYSVRRPCISCHSFT